MDYRAPRLDTRAQSLLHCSIVERHPSTMSSQRACQNAPEYSFCRRGTPQALWDRLTCLWDTTYPPPGSALCSYTAAAVLRVRGAVIDYACLNVGLSIIVTILGWLSRVVIMGSCFVVEAIPALDDRLRSGNSMHQNRHSFDLDGTLRFGRRKTVSIYSRRCNSLPVFLCGSEAVLRVQSHEIENVFISVG